MASSIIVGECDGEGGAWLWDNTEGCAYGPRFEDADEADFFLQWCAGQKMDPRKIDAKMLREQVADFRGLVQDEKQAIRNQQGG